MMMNIKTGDFKIDSGHFSITAVFFIKLIIDSNNQINRMITTASDSLIDTDCYPDEKRPDIKFDSRYYYINSENYKNEFYRHSFFYEFANGKKEKTFNME